MTIRRVVARRGAIALIALTPLAIGWITPAGAQLDPGEPFSFAVIATDTASDADRTTPLVRAIDVGAARFIVHAELSGPSRSACSDISLARRRTLLDASAKPVVPIASASEWADCREPGAEPSDDPFERLQRVGDALFAADRSLGQAPMSWSRQSAIPRFRRYRENVRWQSGAVMFATINLPNNNNDYRIGAGRNGEFEDRVVANRAWLERTFRLATERKLRGVVLFVDAAPRFSIPIGAPDSRSRERDGYYEWKLALREVVGAFRERVLLVQARYAAGVRPTEADHPLRDAAGRPMDNLLRIAAPEADGEPRWLRVDVDPADPKLFRVSTERTFDDPSGELYGPARTR